MSRRALCCLPLAATLVAAPLAVAVTGGAAGSAPPALEDLGRRHGVRVYRRPSRIIDLIGEGELAASPQEVQAVLIDYARHPQFVRGLKESRVLERGPNRLRVYQRLDLPFIADRDFTLTVTWGKSGEMYWVRFRTENEGGLPPRPGVVRVTRHDGSWELRPVAGEGGAPVRTMARYAFRLDIAGALPRWLGRAKAGREVPALFEGLREQVRRAAAR